MLIKLLQWILSIALFASIASILVISSGYIILKPNLPEINLVNENALQVPLKVFSKDEVLIGEFGEQKRRTIEYQDIPINVKNAFLAAEDDKFFEHRRDQNPFICQSILSTLAVWGNSEWGRDYYHAGRERILTL